MKKHHLFASVAVALVLVLGSGGAAAASTALLPPTISSTSTTFTVEAPARFTFRSPAGSAEPVRYEFQLNASPPRQVDARNGRAAVTLFPDSFTNRLSVTSLSFDGSRSDPATFTFNAAFPSPFADQDVDGDGAPDLITVGGTSGLSSGLWQATGHDDNGRVQIPALNIGITGNGVFGDNSPTDFDGAQVVTGKFAGTSFEDFLVYYPGGPNAGGGAVITGNGRGAVLSAQLSGHEFTIPAGMLTDLNGDNPAQIVNAYDAAGRGGPFPDLMAIVGDPINGYNLDYYPSLFGVGFYDLPTTLTVSTPTGGTDWQNWRIASKLLPSGVALLLWNANTGALYLWEGVTFSVDTGGLSYAAYPLASNWQPGAQLSTLQLTDFNADGVPDVWAVAAGDVTAFTTSNLSPSGPATIRAGRPQHLQ